MGRRLFSALRHPGGVGRAPVHQLRGLSAKPALAIGTLRGASGAEARTVTAFMLDVRICFSHGGPSRVSLDRSIEEHPKPNQTGPSGPILSPTHHRHHRRTATVATPHVGLIHGT